MTTAAVIGIIAAVLVIATMLAFVVRVAVVLRGFSARLADVVSAVGSMADRTAPIGPAVEALERDLDEAQQLLASASKTEASNGDGTPAEPPASAEPAEPPEPEPEPAAEPAEPAEPEPEPIVAPNPDSGAGDPTPASPDRLGPMRPNYVRLRRPGTS